MRCGKCKVVAYCNYNCQRTGWKKHKEICNKVLPPTSQADLKIKPDPISQRSGAPVRPAPELQPVRESPSYVAPAKRADTLNYGKWDSVGDSDDDDDNDDAKASADSAAAKAAVPSEVAGGVPKSAETVAEKDRRERAEAVVQLAEKEIDRLAKEIAKTSASSLTHPRLTGGVERDLRYVLAQLEEDAVPVLPDHPAVLFFRGALHFLLRCSESDPELAASHVSVAKECLLRAHDDKLLPQGYRLNGCDFLGVLLQADGELEQACAVVEHANEIAATPERYLLMGRSRTRLAATLEGEDRMRNLRIARSHFERSTALEPRNEKPYVELDAVLELLGERVAQLSLADRCVREGVWWEQRFQRPAHFLRGLPTLPWHNASHFGICRGLEDGFAEVASEILALDAKASRSSGMADGQLLETVLRARPKSEGEESRRWCPKTLALLDTFAEVVQAAAMGIGEVALLHLMPGCRISRRCGATNMRLTCHLGIGVPAECRITVSDETRPWQEGKCLLFDDSFEHSIENAGDERCLLLMVQFWHPAALPDQWEAYARPFTAT